MKKPDESVEERLDEFCETAASNGEGIDKGDARKANRASDLIFEALYDLRDAKCLSSLSRFLNHPDPWVRTAAAAYLLEVEACRREAEKVLEEEAAKESGGASFSAEMTLQEWRKGVKSFIPDKNRAADESEEYSPQWRERIKKAQEEKYFVIDGKEYPRIPYGDEPEDWGADDFPCHDCGVVKGQLHVPGCDVERCPKCHGQVLGCECDVDHQFE